MAQENAEVLAGICLAELVRPGTPVSYGGICHAFDMRTTQLIFAGPEQAIFSVAMTQMGRHYGLPVYANAGLTDAKCPDAQAGLEAGITLLVAAAAGADVFGHMGICGVDQAASLDILMLQDEIIRYVESTLRELDFSDDALGLDVLEALGPGGTLIDTSHTAAHFRKELWMPRLLDRRFFQAWHDAGAQDTAERCRLRKQQCLSAAACEPLPDDLARALDEIVVAARRELL
jgi:trimethylamine--corrinoid protein Co-methyltransferase